MVMTASIGLNSSIVGFCDIVMKYCNTFRSITSRFVNPKLDPETTDWQCSHRVTMDDSLSVGFEFVRITRHCSIEVCGTTHWLSCVGSGDWTVGVSQLRCPTVELVIEPVMYLSV